MTAFEVLTALMTGDPCPYWVRQAAAIVDPPYFGGVYDTTAVNFFPETTVRIPAEGVTRRGNPRLQRRRLDLVGLVQPHYKAFEPFAIGVEIKVSESDLLLDRKLADYPPYVHLFYLAVPYYLEQAARLKLEELGIAGLLVIDSVHSVIVKQHAFAVQPTDAHLKELYAELLLRPFKLAKKERKLFIQFV